MTHDDALKIIGLLSSIHWWMCYFAVYVVVVRISDRIGGSK